MGLVWRLGGFDGFDTFFFSLYKALRYASLLIVRFAFGIYVGCNFVAVSLRLTYRAVL